MSTADYQREWRKRHGATQTRGRPITAPCGTPSAYARHLANRETPCPACRRAHADRIAQYRDARMTNDNGVT